MTTIRVSQVVAESIGVGSPKARSSQVVAETLGNGSPNARASQAVLEALLVRSPHLRASQVIIEVLQGILTVAAPPIYPSMPGLGYSTFWTPNFYSQSETTSDGVNVDASLSAAPTHEFELTYDFLRQDLIYGSTEFRTFMGFFLRMGGQAGRFLFQNPIDKSVTGQAVGTTVSLQTTYGPLQRTYGVAPNTGTENIGYIDLGQTLNVYLNGVLQAPANYSILSTTPGNQQLVFGVAPAAGQAITIDMGYYYYCKFTTDNMTFEEFMRGLSLIKKVVLRSCKAGT